MKKETCNTKKISC